MTVYRLTRRRYSGLDGEGARRVGGRCNPVGIAAVYASEHVSLAILEVLVHLDKAEIPEDYVLMGLEIPDQAVPLATPEEAREIALRRTKPIVKVSSVVAPREFNYVLYPDAPGLTIHIRFVEPFSFDERLFLPTRLM